MSAVDWWKGEAGDAYTERQADTVAARETLWTKIYNAMRMHGAWPHSILEVGANRGQNLEALRRIGRDRNYDDLALFAVEPNDKARSHLGALVKAAWPTVDEAGPAEMVFTSGVLIHIPPDGLKAFCGEIYARSREWIVAIEYFSAEPRMVPYRGENDRLWTRDFGAFYLDNFPDLVPIACGFAWKRLTGLDDLTWWVLRKEKHASI